MRKSIHVKKMCINNLKNNSDCAIIDIVSSDCLTIEPFRAGASGAVTYPGPGLKGFFIYGGVFMFKEGDKVKWTSKSGGSTTTKKGIVLNVIQKDASVYNYSTKYWNKYNNRKMGGGGKRNHESYLILVGKDLYWPRVCYLEKDE